MRLVLITILSVLLVVCLIVVVYLERSERQRRKVLEEHERIARAAALLVNSSCARNVKGLPELVSKKLQEGEPLLPVEERLDNGSKKNDR